MSYCICGHHISTHGDRAVGACIHPNYAKRCKCLGYAPKTKDTFAFCKTCQAIVSGVDYEGTFICLACTNSGRA